MLLAVNADDVASPLEFVDTTQTLEVGFPPEQDANVPVAPEVGAVNVTLTPETGLPAESVTFATSGEAKELCTVADCGEPDDEAMAVGWPELTRKVDSSSSRPVVVFPRPSVDLTNTV